MEKITLDFHFPKYSIEYGRFLLTCRETDPDIEINDISNEYPGVYRTGYLFVTVDAPESLAIILKLQFGNELRTRPLPTTTEKDTDAMFSTYMMPALKKYDFYTNSLLHKNNTVPIMSIDEVYDTLKDITLKYKT